MYNIIEVNLRRGNDFHLDKLKQYYAFSLTKQIEKIYN